jgi:hypothetical protein
MIIIEITMSFILTKDHPPVLQDVKVIETLVIFNDCFKYVYDT